MQEPTQINFTGDSDNGALYQGSTFEAIITVRDTDGKPVDMSPYSVRSEVRQKASDATAVWTFDASFQDVTEDDVTYPSGAIRLFLGATVSKTIAPGAYVYDVELELQTDPDIVIKPCVGRIKLKAEVTR